MMKNKIAVLTVLGSATLWAWAQVQPGAGSPTSPGNAAGRPPIGAPGNAPGGGPANPPVGAPGNSPGMPPGNGNNGPGSNPWHGSGGFNNNGSGSNAWHGSGNFNNGGAWRGPGDAGTNSITGPGPDNGGMPGH